MEDVRTILTLDCMLFSTRRVARLVLDKKADKDENMLVEVYGTKYREYRAVVAKFVPRLY